MSCDWKGNCRFGVALAMRHKLTWFIQLRAQGLSKEDEHPTNTPHRVWYSVLVYRDCYVMLLYSWFHHVLPCTKLQHSSEVNEV